MRDLTSAVLSEVREERERQNETWGPPDRRGHDFATWFPILMEEVGEASQAFLQERPADMIEELVQVAAVAVAMIEAIRLDFAPADAGPSDDGEGETDGR